MLEWKRLDYFIDPIRYYFRKRREYNYLKKLRKKMKFEKILDKTIVFNTTFSLITTFDTEIFTGMVLALHGAKVFILIDNGKMVHWDFTTFDNLSNIQKLKTKNLNPYYGIKRRKNLYYFF